MQFANVISGGSLTQDIPSPDRHNHPPSPPAGTVSTSTRKPSAIILAANTAEVYSNHHQAVKDLGKNLKIVARSPDGVPEALERTDGPFGLFASNGTPKPWPTPATETPSTAPSSRRHKIKRPDMFYCKTLSSKDLHHHRRTGTTERPCTAPPD